MTVGQFDAFVADIAERGIRQPIETIDDSIIVDGRSRWRAAQQLRLPKVPVTAAKINGDDPVIYMLRAATKRRHLTPDQLACLAFEEMQILAAASRSERARKAGQAGGKRRAAQFDSSPITSAAELRRDRATEIRTTVAARYGISQRKLRYAQILRRDRPDTFELVKSGCERLVVAKRQLDRENVQRELAQAAADAEHGARISWEIRCDDCLIEMSRIEAGTVRLVFTDPPYNIGIDYGQGEDADQLNDCDYLDWCQQWIAQCVRLLTPDGSLWLMINDEYADYFGIMLGEAGLHRRAWIKWYETFGVNCTNNFNRCSRHIFYCVKDANRFVFNREAVCRPSDRQTKYDDDRADPAGKIWDNVWRIPRLVGTSKERIPGFPTQLPLELVRPIVECASLPNDIVLDPFSGSGTTGAAAIETGRAFIGIEQNPTYAEQSRLRLRATQTRSRDVPVR